MPPPFPFQANSMHQCLERPHCVCSFIDPWALGLLSALTTVNRAAVNLIFERGTPRIGTAGSYGHCTSHFLRNCHTIFHSGRMIFSFYMLTKSTQGLQCLHILAETCDFLVLRTATLMGVQGWASLSLNSLYFFTQKYSLESYGRHDIVSPT